MAFTLRHLRHRRLTRLKDDYIQKAMDADAIGIIVAAVKFHLGVSSKTRQNEADLGRCSLRIEHQHLDQAGIPQDYQYNSIYFNSGLLAHGTRQDIHNEKFKKY